MRKKIYLLVKVQREQILFVLLEKEQRGQIFSITRKSPTIKMI